MEHWFSDAVDNTDPYRTGDIMWNDGGFCITCEAGGTRCYDDLEIALPGVHKAWADATGKHAMVMLDRSMNFFPVGSSMTTEEMRAYLDELLADEGRRRRRK